MVALRALYPSAPAHWREALADTLQQKAIESIPANVREFWEKDVGLGKRSAQIGDTRPGKRPLISLPPASTRNSLLERIGEPLLNIALELKNLIAQYERYAEATGDSYYLVNRPPILGCA